MAGGRQTVRYAVAAVASLAAAWPAFEFALVSTLRVTDPASALEWRPGDGPALAKLVNRRIEKDRTYKANAEDTRTALRSLIATPLDRSSLRIIGLNAELNGDRARARSAMQLSDRVSRRDSLAQVWLLERAAERDDFEGFLAHYHAALSVTPELGEVLRPILVSAVKYPQVREAAQPYLRNNAPWAPAFLAKAAVDAEPGDAFDMTLPVARWLSGKQYQAAIAQMAFRLAANGRPGDALKLAEATWGDFDAKAFTSPAPNRVTTDERLGRLAWSLANGGGISVRTNDEGQLNVSIDPLARGSLASRDFPVQGGSDYTLTQRVKFSGRAERVRIAWRADCVAAADEPARRVWDQPIPPRSEATTYRSTISVPAGCNLVTLTLSGTGPESQPPANLSLEQIEFARSAR